MRIAEEASFTFTNGKVDICPCGQAMRVSKNGERACPQCSPSMFSERFWVCWECNGPLVASTHEQFPAIAWCPKCNKPRALLLPWEKPLRQEDIA